MDPFEAASDTRERPGWPVGVGMVALVLLVTIGSICLLWQGWNAALQRAQIQAANTAILIEHDITATLDKVMVALGSISAELEVHVANLEAPPWTMIDGVVALVPEIAAVGVFDGDGHPLCREPIARCMAFDMAERDEFKRLKADPAAARRLFGPVRSRMDGRWSFVLVQPLRKPGGAFGGVVASLVPLDAFKSLIASLDLGATGAVSIRMDDLRLALRHPGSLRSDDEARNLQVADELVAALRIEVAHGAFRAGGRLDGIDRQNAYRRFARYPLFVIAGLGTDEALHTWRTQAAWTLWFLLGFIGTSTAVLVLVRSRMRQRERLHEELEQRVRQRTRQLRELAGELELAENRERQQLARDLHDDLGQILAAARIRLEGLCRSPIDHVREAACRVARLVEQADRATRSLAAQLAPAVLYELGLAPAIERLGEEILRNFGMQVNVVDDGRPKPLSPETSSILYRCARELLVNAAKHAMAEQADVSVERRDERVVVRVADCGIGFDVAARHAGSGLRSVRERLSYIGGALHIRSVAGEGTEAILSAPLAREEAGAAAQGGTIPSRTA